MPENETHLDIHLLYMSLRRSLLVKSRNLPGLLVCKFVGFLFSWKLDLIWFSFDILFMFFRISNSFLFHLAMQSYYYFVVSCLCCYSYECFPPVTYPTTTSLFPRQIDLPVLHVPRWKTFSSMDVCKVWTLLCGIWNSAGDGSDEWYPTWCSALMLTWSSLAWDIYYSRGL